MTRIKLLTFIFLTIFGSSAIAQVDQLTALQGIGEGSIFKSYWGVKTENGVTSGQASDQYKLVFDNDDPTRGNAFEMVDPVSGKARINSYFGFIETNHLTKPSFYYYEHTVYVYINGLLYKLKGIKDLENITSFTIDDLYVLMKPVQGTDLSGKLASKEMKTRDHQAVIVKYFSDMKAIQATATTGFTAEESNQLVMREQAKADKKAGIAAKNAAYWNSEEGQRVLAKSRQPELTLTNDTASPLYLCYGSGAYYELKPGSSKTFACSSGKVYRGTIRPNNSSQYDKTNNLLLDGNGSNCGRVVNASSVIKY